MFSEAIWGVGRKEKGGRNAYEWRRHGHGPSLIPRLHHGRVDAFDGVGQGVEIGNEELVLGEVVLQDVEEVHQPRGYVLRHRQVGAKGQLRSEVADERVPTERVVERSGAGRVAEPEEAGRDGVDVLGVEFEKVAVVVDEDGALQGLLGGGIVADAVVGEIVEDLEREDVAGCVDVDVPGEDGPVDDFHVLGVTSGRGRPGELGRLQRCERGGYLDDFELGSGVHVRVDVTDVVQHVQHQRSVSRTQLIDYEVLRRVVRQLVIRDQVSGNSFAVVGPKELSRGMPQLSGVIRHFKIKLVFKGSISLAQLGVEFRLVGHAIEIEGLAGVEDDSLLGKVAIIWIVKAI